jgi:small subunit ribosomal protein S8
MDPISDMIIRIKNTIVNNEKELIVPSSKFKIKVLEVLKNENYVSDFSESTENNKKMINIKLKYENKLPLITHFKKISKPGLRIYKGYKDIPRPLNNMGLVIVSTPDGVISGRDARRKKIGGELICEVY